MIIGTAYIVFYIHLSLFYIHCRLFRQAAVFNPSPSQLPGEHTLAYKLHITRWQGLTWYTIILYH